MGLSPLLKLLKVSKMSNLLLQDAQAKLNNKIRENVTRSDFVLLTISFV
jgi:hypothetical protein